MITISNAGPEITSTNYWEMPAAKAGYLYLSINARAFRLLVPPTMEGVIPEMLTGKEAIVSRGPWEGQGQGRDALEVLFEDKSDDPYCVHLVAEQVDRMPAASDDRHEDLTLSIWTEAGKQGEMPARYRIVPALPYLEPWA